MIGTTDKSKFKTTIAVFRDIIGPTHGGEVRFAQLVKRSPSWVKKVSAGVIRLSEETARLLELETGVALDWLMKKKKPFGPPVNGRGERYTKADFEWHRAAAKAGTPLTRSVGYPFNYSLKIMAIGAAAGGEGKAGLFLWRLRTFLEECAQEFGFDEKARAFAEAELRKVPSLAQMRFFDVGFDMTDLSDPRVVRALKKAMKGTAPGEPIKVKVRLPPKREKKQRKR